MACFTQISENYRKWWCMCHRLNTFCLKWVSQQKYSNSNLKRCNSDWDLNPLNQDSNLVKNQYGTWTHAKPHSIPTEITHLISTLEAQVLDVSSQKEFSERLNYRPVEFQLNAWGASDTPREVEALSSWVQSGKIMTCCFKLLSLGMNYNIETLRFLKMTSWPPNWFPWQEF